MVKETQLYDLIGVEPDATSQQIKKAYYKKSLAVHPDRNNDPSATARFQELQRAYEILSDGKKRQVYDQLGDAGVSTLDSQFASPVVHMVGGGPIALLAASIFAFLVVVGLLMLLAGLTAKIDGVQPTWSYVHALFGVWFTDAFVGLIALVHFFFAYHAFKEKQKEAAATMTGIGITFSLFVAWTALVGINLDRAPVHHRVSWMATNAPGLAALAVVFVAGCIIVYLSLPVEANAFQFEKWQSRLLGLIRVLCFLCPFAQLLLISLKADGKLDSSSSSTTASWYVVLTPAFAFTLLRGLSSAAASCVMRFRGEVGWGSVLRHEICSWAISHCCYLVGVGLVAEKLENPGSVTRTWAVCFIPWFIVLGLGVFGSCCMICTLPAAVAEMNERAAADEFTEPTEATPTMSASGSNARHSASFDTSNNYASNTTSAEQQHNQYNATSTSATNTNAATSLRPSEAREEEGDDDADALYGSVGGGGGGGGNDYLHSGSNNHSPSPTSAGGATIIIPEAPNSPSSSS